MEFKLKTMLTVNDLKKRVQVGTKLEGVRHNTKLGYDPDTKEPVYGDKLLGVRQVVAVKGKAFAFEAEVNGETVLSWCDFPKASELRYIDNDTFSIFREDSDGRKYKKLTYKFV